MPWNGSGTFSRVGSAYTAGSVIDQDAVNAEIVDIASGISNAVAKDGQTAATANLPMGGFRHTNVGDGSARNHYAALGQVQNGAATWCGTAGGTANALTLTPSPAITAYAAGQEFRFIPSTRNTSGTVTVNVSGVGAKSIVAVAGPIDVGALSGSAVVSIVYDGTNFQLREISEAKNVKAFGARGDGSTDDTTAINAALASGGAVYFPAGTYVIGTALTAVSNTALHVWGAGIGQTVLQCTFASGNGLTISNADYTQPVTIERLSIVTTQAEPGDAINITYSTSDAASNRRFLRCWIDRVEVRGDTLTADGWTRGIVGSDVHNWRITGCIVSGRRNDSLSGRAKYVSGMTDGILTIGDASAIPANTVVSTTAVFGALYAFRSNGAMEGLIISDCKAVASGTGVKCDRSTGRPWVRTIGNHFDVFDYGVDIENAPQFVIANNLIYKQTESAADTTAIRVDTCDFGQINGNMLVNQCTDASTDGEWHGIAIIDSTDVIVDGNFHERPSGTITISGTSDRCRISRHMDHGAYTNATVTGIVDSSGNTNSYFASGSNASPVTTPNTGITVVDVAVGTVRIGERFRVTCQFRHVKGGTAGDTAFTVTNAGGATAVFHHDDIALRWRQNQGAGTTVEGNMAGVIRITAGGTLTLRVTGTSLGSDGTVAATFGTLVAERLERF